MKIRVAFVTANLAYGGSQAVMTTLFNHLNRAVFDPYFISFRAEGPNLGKIDIPERVVNLGVPRVRYGVYRFLKAIWRIRPNVVLSTLGYVNLVLILVRPLLPRGVKLLVREGNTLSSQLALNRRNARMWGWLYRRFYKKADKIICQSDYMLNDLEENFGVPRQKMVRIYNPVDVDRLRQLADAEAGPYSGAGPHLVAAGRLTYQKGFDLLLEAMALVLKSFPRAQLTILGDGPLAAPLKAQRERLGLTKTVCFAGFQLNPYPCFKHADLFVLSSRYEGLPNVLLEALALGTPVLATDCPSGVREIAAHFPRCTLLRGEDPAVLARGILQVLGDDKSNNRGWNEQGRLEAFDVHHVTAQYEALFQKVIDACPA